MFRLRKHTFAAIISIFALGGTGALAQTPEQSPLADGELSKQELAAIITLAEQQLTQLADAATKEYLPVIQRDQAKMPQAWMLMEDGETVKRINLDDQTDGAPPAVRIVMYRAALKSLARRGLINAGAILYAGPVSEDNNADALVIEHEHRLGVSANKVVGYRLEEDKVVWGKPVTDTKPFEWFYDAKKDPS